MLFWIFGIAAGLVVLFFIATYLCYRVAFSVPKEIRQPPEHLMPKEQYADKKQEIIALLEEVKAIPYEDVYVTSYDGLRLHGQYYCQAESAPLMIFFHGYCSAPLRDFAGGVQMAYENGCNAILVDQRAHGKSEGKCLTFGVKERLDCLSWCHYAVSQFGAETPIILVGMSMGSATVMMASELELPSCVKGIIADCGYATQKEIISKVIKSMKMPVKISYFMVKLGAKIYGNFDLESCNAQDALAHAKVPVLFIHGEDDRFVPHEMTLRNYAACQSEKTLLTVPKAGHGLSYLMDRDAYRKAVKTFVEKII